MHDNALGRLREIKSLPDYMQDDALVDWSTAAALLNTCVPSARKIVRDNNIPVVAVSERKNMPRWAALRNFIKSRERVAKSPAA